MSLKDLVYYGMCVSVSGIEVVPEAEAEAETGVGAEAGV